MKIRKTLAVLLAVLIAISAFSVAAAADSEGIYTYSVSNGQATVTGVNYAGIKELSIPETLGGYPVTTVSKIGNTVSFGTSNMVETLYIPACVISVGWGALRDFDCATVVVAEDNPNYSSDEYGVLFNKDKTALVGCPCSFQQKEYTVPETVKTIEYCAFEKCAFIEKIVLPLGLESMGNQSFCQMPKLKEINIPEGITELGQNMFIQCRSLENITLPSTLVRVSNSSLSETPIKNIVVPDGVTSLDTYAFESCKQLEYAELPASVQTIGYEVFGNCSSLKYIFYRGSEEDWSAININASNENELSAIKIVYNYSPETGYPGIDFSFSDGLLRLTGDGSVSDFSQGDYHYWDTCADSCEVLVIDGDITGIGAYSFENFTALEYIIVYAGNIVFAENAFSGCTALDTVIITSAAQYTASSFNAPETATIYVDITENPGKAPEANTAGYSCSDGVLNFTDEVTFDLYHLLDVVAALGEKYGEIKKITFGKLSFTDLEMSYIADYADNEPVIRPIEGNTLVNGEITVRSLNGDELTFNGLVDKIAAGTATGFVLLASDETHPVIINSDIGVENPDEPDKPDNPDKPDEPEEPEEQEEENGIAVFFETVSINLLKAIKWAVTLLNKLFKVISKK